MAKGESSFDASKRKVKRFDNKPPTPGEYDFKVRTSKAAITVADGVGKLPYINGVQFELLDSAENEGGKNRVLYKSFFLKVSPDADGVAAVDRGDGLVAFSKSIGVNLKLGEGAVIKKPAKDKNGKEYTALLLDPKKVAAWLKEQDGSKGSLRSKVRKDKDDPEKQYGDVAYFIESEGADEEDEETEEESEETEETEEDEDTDSDDEETEEDEDEDEEVEDEEESDDEEEEDDDEEEEEPAPKKKAKPAAKKGKGKKGKK